MWLETENKQRNPENKKPLVIIMDGQPSLWTAAERLPENRIEILDLLHATPRIWDASKLFYTKHEDNTTLLKTGYYEFYKDKSKALYGA